MAAENRHIALSLAVETLSKAIPLSGSAEIAGSVIAVAEKYYDFLQKDGKIAKTVDEVNQVMVNVNTAKNDEVNLTNSFKPKAKPDRLG